MKHDEEEEEEEAYSFTAGKMFSPHFFPFIFVVKQTLDQIGSDFVEKHLSLRPNVQKVCAGWMPRGRSASLGSVKLHSSNVPATSHQLPAAPLVEYLNDFSILQLIFSFESSI